jgi:hypothetical protein
MTVYFHGRLHSLRSVWALPPRSALLHRNLQILSSYNSHIPNHQRTPTLTGPKTPSSAQTHPAAPGHSDELESRLSTAQHPPRIHAPHHPLQPHHIKPGKQDPGALAFIHLLFSLALAADTGTAATRHIPRREERGLQEFGVELGVFGERVEDERLGASELVAGSGHQYDV